MPEIRNPGPLLQLERCTCHDCGTKLDGFTPIGDQAVLPGDGDLSICAHCGAELIYIEVDGYLQTRPLNQAERDHLAAHPDIQAALDQAKEAVHRHRLGDAPIEPHHHAMMNGLARGIDRLLNGDARGADRKTGFILMVFPFEGHEGRCNYISNGADRKDVAVLMREQAARFEGQPEVKGHA